MTAGIAFHAVFAALVAGGIGVLTLSTNVQAPFGITSGRASVLGAALGGVAILAGIASALWARRWPVRAVTVLAVAFACVLGQMSDAEVGGSPVRASSRDFGRGVRAIAPAGTELVALDPVDAAPVIYYADRVVPYLSREQLGAHLAANPGLIAIAREKTLSEGGVSGTTLLAEHSDDDPRVLLAGVRILK